MQVIILGKPTEHKGFHIICQNMGNIFQAIIFKDGNFYQVHNFIKYPETRNRFTTKELENGYKFILNQAIATCELIVNKDNPEVMHEQARAQAKTKKQKEAFEILDAVEEEELPN